MSSQQTWEYCLLSCTPLPGQDEEGIRLSCQVAGPEGTRRVEVQRDEPSPLAALGHLFNQLGADGWELVAFDTTTHRGVFKRPKPNTFQASSKARPGPPPGTGT
ncbi:MAG: hypothetical protein PVF47_14635 [Anaerolineae bacterium]